MRWGWMVVAATALLWPATKGLVAQEAAVTGSAVALSSGTAALELELADGETRVIAFRDGEIMVDGEARGAYEPGGALEGSWRALLGNPELFASGDVAERLADWIPESAGDAEAASSDALQSLFDRLAEGADQTTAAALPETATVAGPGGGQVSIAPGTLSLTELTRSVELLRSSLDRLGAQAAGVGGDLALVVHDDYTIGAERVVEGNLALLSGDLSLEGEVTGDVLVLDGTLTLAPTSSVGGNVMQVGGDVITSGGRVDTGIDADVAVDVDTPLRVHVRPGGRGFIGSIGHNIGHTIGGVVGVLAWLLALGAMGAVVVYFFRRRLEVVADTVRNEMVRSFGVGLAGQLLVLPVLLLLVVGIVTWLVIPVYALAVALAVPAAYLAAAHAVGEMAAEQRFSWVERFNLRRTNSYYYVVSGLVFLLAPFAIGSALYLLGGMLGFVRGLTFFAAGVLTWAAITTGFGAILLTRAGGRRSKASVDMDDLFSAPDPVEKSGGEASA